MVQFVFTGASLDVALRKLLDRMQTRKLDGYHVVDVVIYLVTVYWRVVVYCLASQCVMTRPHYHQASTAPSTILRRPFRNEGHGNGHLEPAAGADKAAAGSADPDRQGDAERHRDGHRRGYGRAQERPPVPKRRALAQASAPGESPAIDMGALAGSIQQSLDDHGDAGTDGLVYTNAEMGPYLEYGTGSTGAGWPLPERSSDVDSTSVVGMAPRPYMTPAAERAGAGFEEKLRNLEQRLDPSDCSDGLDCSDGSGDGWLARLTWRRNGSSIR